MEDLNQYVDSYEESFPYARENRGLLSAYAKEVVAGCKRFKGAIDVCSLGIGYETVSRCLSIHLSERDAGSTYAIVEGSQLMIENYKKNSAHLFSANLVHSYFEKFEPDHCFDVIEMGFVLEHVDNPLEIVSRFAKFLKPHGMICAAVPNALSLHRVLGVRAGLLHDPYALSEWDKQLGHKRYFDRESFLALFRQPGMTITKEAGLTLKPFATSQMNALNLPDAIWKVLFESGDLAPHYACGLYAEAQMKISQTTA